VNRALLLLLALTAGDARADEEKPPPPPQDPPPAPAQPPPDPQLAPAQPPPDPAPAQPPPEQEPKPKMSEGRALVSAYHSGFQWGLAPGILIGRGKTSFLLAARLGYGFDLGPVILSPGVRVGLYFVDPNVYQGIPLVKILFPVDRFAPFLEGGAGIGHIISAPGLPAHTGAALLAGGGFMVHFTKVVLGAEAMYQTMPGTDFSGLSIGPILAIGF
jgi:hypothetical protein